MQCPTDGAALVMSERTGIEIDYCPTCRGVWLDRGELDKIIDRGLESTARQSRSPQDTASSSDPFRRATQTNYPESRVELGEAAHHRKRKRDSWLSDLFD